MELLTIKFLFSAVFVLIGSLAFNISALVSGENIYRDLKTLEATLLSTVVGIVIFLLSPISFIIFSYTDYIDVLTGILDFKVLLAFFGCAFGLGLIFGCVTILEARVRILNWFRDKSGMCFWISSYGITWAAFLDGVKRKGEIFIQTDNGIFKGLLVAFSIRDGQREIVLGKSKIKKYGIEKDIAGEENEEVLIPGSEIKRIIVPERSFKKHYEPMVHISQAFYCIILAIGFFFLSFSAHLTGNYIPNLEIARLKSFYGWLSPIFLALTIIILGVSVWVAQKDFGNWRSFLVLSPPITFVALFSSLLAILLILFNMKISQALILIFALAFISPLYIKILDWLDKHEGSIKEAYLEGIRKIGDWKSFLSLPSSNVLTAVSVLLLAILFILIRRISLRQALILIFALAFISPLYIKIIGWLDKHIEHIKIKVCFENIGKYCGNWKSFLSLPFSNSNIFAAASVSLLAILFIFITGISPPQLLIFIFVFSLLCITISTWLKKPIKDCFDKIKEGFDDNTELLEVINNFYLQLSCNDKDKARIRDIKGEFLEKYKHEEGTIEKLIANLDKLKGYLFSMELRLEGDLTKGIIPKELKDRFTEKNSLPENPTCRIKGDNKWVITDKEKKKTLYIVWKVDGKLKIFKKDNRKYLENEDFNIISRFKYFIKKEKG